MVSIKDLKKKEKKNRIFGEFFIQERHTLYQSKSIIYLFKIENLFDVFISKAETHVIQAVTLAHCKSIML